MLQVHVRSTWLPKAGNSAEEYEDAYFPHHTGKRSGKQLNLAVADGASEGMLSGQWAQILVRSFCRQTNTSARMDELLARAHYSWEKWQAHYLDLRERQNRPVQWYEEPGLRKGAFATLLGLSLAQDGDAARWSALALGDSCLFQVRDNQLIAAFPLDQAADFDNRPFLLASNPALNKGLNDHVHQMEGDAQSGDRLLMMTDALAQWFLHDCETGGTPWTVFDLTTQHDFEQWIQTLRHEHTIRNDDVTLLALDIS